MEGSPTTRPEPQVADVSTYVVADPVGISSEKVGRPCCAGVWGVGVAVLVLCPHSTPGLLACATLLIRDDSGI
jgi:hypothetical protein